MSSLKFRLQTHFPLLFFTLFIKPSDSFYELEPEQETQFCLYRDHLTFSPTGTCCGGKVLQPGIGLNLTDLWEGCAKETKEMGPVPESVEDTGWAMYGCLLKKYYDEPDKSEISLQEFSDLMTSEYPEDIKEKINAEIQKLSIPSAQLQADYENLNKIRSTYYDIEEAVCSRTPYKEPEDDSSFSPNCLSWKEENHRAGMCCNKAYPLDLRYGLRIQLQAHKTKWKECFDNLLHPNLHNLGANEMMQSSIKEMCDIACEMEARSELNLMDDIINNRDYWEFNMTNELFINEKGKQWVPSFLGEGLVAQAMEWVNSIYSIENATDTIMNYTFADLIDTESHTFRPNYNVGYVRYTNLSKISNQTEFKADFVQRKFHKQIIHIPILCVAYHDIAVLMDHAVFGNCSSFVQPDPVDVEE